MIPTVGVNHTAVGVNVGVNVGEVLITFGQTVMDIQPDGDGKVRATGTVNWLHTASMSPQVAMQLQQRLASVLMDYAMKFGGVPQDPAFAPDHKTLQ